MTSITQAFGKVLNTVATVADAATKVVDNTTAGLDMLDVFVSTAKQKQAANTAKEMETFYEDLIKEAALEAAMKQEALDNELNNNPALKKHYEKYHKDFETVLLAVKAKYQPV